ncbi:hypothetical protein JA1_002594 [Spathaspora sp. JA1]|nr:hypothetical protein JA1_002594 [Spathaspora sp. JA1]
MNQVIENILNETNISSSLSELGDLLRESTNRESEFLHQNLPQLVSQFNKLSNDEELYMSITRVVINLLANNDSNRDFFTQDIPIINQFWQQVLSQGVVIDGGDVRLGILLSQFIYDTEHKPQYLNYLFKFRCQLYPLINKDNFTEVDNLFDIIVELLSSDQELNENDYVFIDRCAEFLVNEEIDEDLSSTMCDIMALSKPGIASMTKVIQLIPQIKQFASIKRKLFVLISELSTSDCIPLAIENLSNSDSYVVAGCCIAIGNEINNPESHKDITSTIESTIGMDQFFKLFFNWEITDVVQIQAVHLLIKLLNKDNVNYILDYETKLIAITKIAFDNARYYQEVCNLHARLLKKICKLNIVEQLEHVWELICEYDNTQEIQYILLQTKVIFPQELLTKLITNAVSSISTNTPVEILLEKLKAIAVLNQMVLEKLIEPYIEDIDNLTEFLQQLLPQLEQISSESGIKQVLVNNSKYVAATTSSVFENVEKSEQLIAICQEILTVRH